MKLQHAALLVCISMGSLSGCAYMEGRKDQTTTPNPKVVSSHGHVIQTQQGPKQFVSQPNPSQTASKMIAPIVQ